MVHFLPISVDMVAMRFSDLDTKYRAVWNISFVPDVDIAGVNKQSRNLKSRGVIVFCMWILLVMKKISVQIFAV